MCEIRNLSEKIRDLRDNMNRLIEVKGNLSDPEIMKSSKILDDLINEYRKISNQKA